MHEFAIASGVIDIAAAHCNSRRVTTVNLRIGALRQVVPATLATAFDVAARGTPCEGARLVQELVPTVLGCPACSHEWTPHEPDFRCFACQDPAVVIAGRELEVESIEVEDQPG
jgi:hydrogenase nickel incorporation protein HypA/HybF